MAPSEMKALVSQFFETRMKTDASWDLPALLSDFGFWVQAYEREHQRTHKEGSDHDRAVAAAEREECAKLCDDLFDETPYRIAGWQYGEAIRARGQE